MKMRVILLLAAGTAALAALLAASVPVGGRVMDEMLFRYPGSGLITVAQLDFADLKRGWVTRQAVYQANTDLTTAVDWYSALMPGANQRFASDCVTLRQRTGFLHSQRVVAVLLCSQPPGTRIMVSEEVYLSP